MKKWFLNLFNRAQHNNFTCTEPSKTKTEAELMSRERIEKPEPVIEVNVTVTTKETQEKHKSVDMLSHLDFDKPVGELGRFLNYQKYKVAGTNEIGKRSFKICSGVDSQQAVEKVAALGLLPPFEIEPIDYELPTERQLNFLRELGVFVPDDITKDDASYMISRAVGEDSEESPTHAMVALANGLKTEFSAFIGAAGLLKSIIGQACDRDRAALYAYGVHQSMRGGSFENMLKDSNKTVFYAFADNVVKDPALMRSLNGRTAEDFVCPNRNTAIYKAVVAFLTAEIITK